MSKTTKNIEYNFSAKDTNVSSTVDKIGSSFDKLGNKAQDSTKKMNNSNNNMKKLGDSAKKAGKDFLYMESSLSNLATKLHNANTKNEKMAKSVKEVSSANRNAVSSLSNLKSELKNLSITKDYDLDKTKKLEASTNELGKTISESKSKLSSMGDTIKQLTNTKRVLLEQLIKAEQSYGKNNEKVKHLRSEYDKVSSTLGQMSKKHIEESSALNRLNQQYDQHKAKLKVFSEKAQEANKAQKAVEKLKATNEALYNKELALHNSIQKTNRQLQSKTLMAKKTTTEISNYRKKVQELSAQLAMEASKQDVSTASLLKFEAKLRMTNATADTYEHKINKLKIAKENLAQTIKEKEVAYKKLSSTMQSNGQEADRLKNDIAELKNTYNLLDSELNSSKAEFKELNKEIGSFDTQLNTAKKNANSFASNMRTLSNDVSKVANNMASAGKQISSFGNMIQQTGRGIINVGNSMRWLSMSGVAVFGGAIKSGLEFDKAMAELASTIDTTELGLGGLGGAMDTLEDKVRSLAKATIFNPAEVADGMKYLSLAGYSTSEMLESIEPMLKMAQIGSMDLASATDLLTDAMASYRMEVKDTPKFLDAMAKLQASSNTNIAQATEAYIWAGGTLSDYNVTLEESASIIGILANQGLKGATAGRSLASIMVNLTKESGESYEALKKLAKLSGEDVFAFDKKGNYKGLEQQLKTIKKALYSDGVTEQDRNTIIQSIAGKTQMKTFTKLMGQINGEYDTLKSKIRNADGALDEMHETVSQSSWAKFKEMLSAIQEALLKVWEAIQPLVMFLIQKTTDLANKFSSLDSAQQLNIIKMLALASIIPTLIKSFGFVVLAIGTVVKAFGWIITGAFKLVSTIANVASSIWGLVLKIVNIGGIGAYIGSIFAKIGSFIETFKIVCMYAFDGIVAGFTKLGAFLGKIGSFVASVVAGIATALSIPAWVVIAIITVLIGLITWMVSAWKRGFDEMANPIENIGNMLKTMGEDLGHFFISIWNTVSGFIGKLTGKSEEEIEKMKKLSQKDKNAIAEGYDNHKDKKQQEKQAEQQAKEQAKQQSSANSMFSKIGDFAKNGFGDLTSTFKMDFDDGGFFDEFGNFSTEYEEFAQDFNNKKNVANFETKIETDALSLIEAEDNLKTLKDEYSEMEVNVELAKDAVAYCNDRIQELISEKRKLEINPEANKKRLQQIDKELDELGERRETNLDIIARGDEKLAEIKKAEEELKDKKITITTEYKELGKGEDLENLLEEETFYRQFGYELLHDDFEADVKFIQDRINSIPDEIDELEAQIDVELDPEKKNQLISELTSLQEEQIMMELTLEYVENTETLQRTQETIDNLQGKLQELKVESSKIEWISKQGIELTDEQKSRLAEIKQQQENINKEIKEQEANQKSANKALEEMDKAGNLDKVVEYVTTMREENAKMLSEMEKTSTAIDGISESADSIDFSGASESADNFSESVDSVKGSIDEIQQKASEETVLNIDTSKAEQGIQNIGKTLDSSFNNLDNVNSKLESIKNTCSNLKVEGLNTSLDSVKSKIDKIRETLISINNIASSTSVQAFTQAGQALITKLQEARTAVLNIAGCARNSGVSAMTTMGQSLTNALSGARQRVLDVANTARNYGASAMRAMGQALVSQLNSARSIVSSIASTARSIKISIPTGGSGGSGGNSRGLLTAQVDNYSIPKNRIGGIAFSSAVAGNTNTSNSFNFNIDRVVMDKGTDIKKTAKQFTIMCQREGILK